MQGRRRSPVKRTDGRADAAVFRTKEAAPSQWPGGLPWCDPVVLYRTWSVAQFTIDTNTVRNYVLLTE